MTPECYPMSDLPHVSRLFQDYLELGEREDSPVRGWYGPGLQAGPLAGGWLGQDVAVAHTEQLAVLLLAQAEEFGAGTAAKENIERLRNGARAVVTGQQVGLFGGPLLTLLKAATAVARAKEAQAKTGVAHVPVFWLATEDHDLAEVDQVTLPGRRGLETLRLGLDGAGREVGGVVLGAGVQVLLDQACELLGWAPVCELLKSCYRPEATLGEAFGRFLTKVFEGHGLVVMDAAGREFHSLGAKALRAGIEQAEELEEALLKRSAELEAAEYSAQVLVKTGASLLFLLDEASGARVALRRVREGWKAGSRVYSTTELLKILETAPERLSPNALLRPVFQDTILPTAAYVGGPAEIAYFAQSAVVYEKILGRVTAVLPRFSATLIGPAVGAVMERHEIELGQLFKVKTPAELAVRLGARAMPIEGKRKLAAAGNALETELSALTEYLSAVDENLGRSAGVAASKMRYQMGRLRRMAARFEVEKEASLRKHAETIMLTLFPDGHLQERVIAGAYFLAADEGLVDRLVQEVAQMCLGHSVVRVS